MNEIEMIDQSPAVEFTRAQAQSDEQLVKLWLHGLSRHTQRAYLKDSREFASFTSKSLHQTTLADLQGFADHLETLNLVVGSRHRKLSAVKSLFAFGHRLGYLSFDVARPLRLPASKDRLNERILDEGQVQRLLALEPHPRNRVILHLLYASAVRVSELVGLKWRDATGRSNGGQITVLGKGNKTRTVLLPSSVWSALVSIRGTAGDDSPIFRSRRGGHLDVSQVLRVVKAAAKRAGISRAVSPHWMRHAHASHALDRGAPIHLVQTTLGHSSIATTGRDLHARPTESSSRYLPL